MDRVSSRWVLTTLFLFVGSFTCLWASWRRSPSVSLFILVGWSSLLGFGAPPLPWLSCLELGLGGLLVFLSSSLAGCHFSASALFLASASFHRCLASILSMIPLAYLLVVHASLPFRSISLASGSFALVFFSSTSLQHSCSCPCFSVLACGLLGHYSWSSFGFCRQCFLVPFLRHSFEYQYPSRRGPPFGPSCLSGVVLGCSGPNRLWSWLFLLLRFWSLVPFFFSFCSWLGGPPSLRIAPLRFLSSSISLGCSPFSPIVWFYYFCLSCG